MNKIFISFLLLSFGILSFNIKTINAQQGCQIYCESVKACCQEQNVGKIFFKQEDCEKKYQECLENYKETETDKCPQPEACN